MTVIYSETSQAWSSFLTNVCAIVGGMYTISSLVDAFIFQAERRLKQKISLGKAS